MKVYLCRVMHPFDRDVIVFRVRAKTEQEARRQAAAKFGLHGVLAVSQVN